MVTDSKITQIIKHVDAFMQKNNVTQKEFAERCGLTQAYLCRVLKGTTASPGIDSVARIATTLGISVSELIGDLSCQPGALKVPLFSLKELNEHWSDLVSYAISKKQLNYLPCPFKISTNGFALRIENNLQAPYMYEGHRAFIDPCAQKNAGAIFLIRCSNEQRQSFCFGKLVKDEEIFYAEILNKKIITPDLIEIETSKNLIVGKVLGCTVEL